MAIALAALALGLPTAEAAEPNVSSLTSAGVTIYGAKWCSACRTLEAGLKGRGIAFTVVDVDENPAAWEKARAASGTGNAIPLSSVVTSTKTTWIVGADVNGIENAARE